MLILTRRLGEAIRIGDDIEVTILEERGHQIRVGVTAPREVPVHRSEVWERIERESVE
jgi:carbon storage regulator